MYGYASHAEWVEVTGMAEDLDEALDRELDKRDRCEARAALGVRVHKNASEAER